MNTTTEKLLAWSQEMQAICTAGLFYTKDRFDKERFERIQELSAEMAALVSDEQPETIHALFEREDIYQTPKLDTRAVIFNEQDEVLLIRELDGFWAPPGGWCEYDLSPADNTVKEAREEAGLEVVPYRLVAVHNQHLHNEPFTFFSVERMFFLCRVLSGGFQENIETTASGWFSLEELPPLHPRKCSPEELRLCLEANRAEHWETRYDLACCGDMGQSRLYRSRN